LYGMELTYIEHVHMDDRDVVRHPAVYEALKVMNV
jgi:phosphate starvation-inducible protein PhoH and related proteins